MNRLIRPLSEQFLYCSPEAMSRELYRLLPAPRSSQIQQQKTAAGDRHDKAKID